MLAEPEHMQAMIMITEHGLERVREVMVSGECPGLITEGTEVEVSRAVDAYLEVLVGRTCQLMAMMVSSGRAHEMLPKPEQLCGLDGEPL